MLSVDPQGGVKCLQQVPFTEGFEKAVDGPAFQRSRTDILTPVSSNENNRNLLPAKRQFALQIRPRHTRHSNVEDQASGLVNIVRRKKVFPRSKRLSLEAEFPQEVGDEI